MSEIEYCEVKHCSCLSDMIYKGNRMCGHHRTELRDKQTKFKDLVFETQIEKKERWDKNE